MSDRRYSKDHEYVALEGDIATLGISDYAQSQLGDIVFIELPDVGKKVAKGKEIAVIESVKAASEVYSPVGGEVVEVNSQLGETPALVNDDPLGRGWLVKVRISDPGECASLMDERRLFELSEDALSAKEKNDALPSAVRSRQKRDARDDRRSRHRSALCRRAD